MEKQSLNALFLAVNVSSFSERANTAASPDKLVNLLYRYPELKEWMKSGDMSSSPNWGKGKNKQGLTCIIMRVQKGWYWLIIMIIEEIMVYISHKEKAEEVYGEVVDQVDEEN